MKYLLVLVLIVVVGWLWSHNRRLARTEADKARSSRQPAEKTALTEIVECQVCHVHLPRSEALIGDKGVFCSDSHRRQANG